MKNFESLSWLIEPWLDKQFAELPERIATRVERDFVPVHWDLLSPEQRRIRALQWDYQNDPAEETRRQTWWNFFRRYDELRAKVAEWHTAEASSASALAEKEDSIADLEREIRQMDRKARRAAANYRPPSPVPIRLKEAAERQAPPIPYPKALAALTARLQTTPEELAAWIFLGIRNGGLAAYRNANELRPPPPFFFDSFMGPDYVGAMMGCWFAERDILEFTPAERFITGRTLLEKWGDRPGIRPVTYIQAKVAESRLQDLHPTFGISQASAPSDLDLPPLEEALFSLTEIEAVEREDFGVLATQVDHRPAAPAPGIAAWHSERARAAANARHNKAGGSRDRREKIIEIWKSGKYDTKDLCAEEECRAFGIAYSTARKYLTNIN